jgi:hypothetical protein
MAQKPKRSYDARDNTVASYEEKIASLFQPDTLMAAQYFDNLRRKTLLEPEKKLTWAILEDAIRTFQDNAAAQDRRGKKLFQETEEWIALKDRDWVFSFENVCETLGLSPEYVRQGLWRWKEKHEDAPRRSRWQDQKLAG